LHSDSATTPSSGPVRSLARRSDISGRPHDDTAAIATTQQSASSAVITRALVVAVLCVAAVQQVLLALIYPPYQGHDEMTHLHYVRTIVEERRMPTLSDNLNPEIAAYSRYTLDWPAMYEAMHPPLYYSLATPAFRLAGADHHAQLYAVRLVSVPLFLLTIWLAARLAALVLPGDRFLACCVPAVVAFQPQLSFEGAIVNNDMLAICLGTLSLLLLLGAIRDGLSARRALLLGVVLGLGLLSKATLTALLPVAGLVAVWCCWPRPWRQLTTRAWWQATLGRALLLLTPVILLALPWYLFLHRTYGDVTAFNALDTIEATWNVPEPSVLSVVTDAAFHTERIRETWGFWGWKLLPLSHGELQLLYAGLVIAGTGAVLAAARTRRTAFRAFVSSPEVDRTTRETAMCIAVLCLAFAAMYGAMVYIATENMLSQARYFFPVLPAVIVLGLLGIREMIPSRLRNDAIPVIIAVAWLFQLNLLVRTVIPYATL
jgi:4-amino-4-deoxy-L-arabinose transferase-like glycosyltransferase